MLLRSSTKTDDKTYSATAICGIMAHTKDRAIAGIGLPAIRVAGESLTKRKEQEEVVDILRKIQKETGWQTGHWIKELQTIWKWDKQIKSEASNDAYAARSNKDHTTLSLSQSVDPTKTDSRVKPNLIKLRPRIYVYAICDYHEKDEACLDFNKGDGIFVRYQSADGWSEGSRSDKYGWFPSKYCVVHYNGGNTATEIEASSKQLLPVDVYNNSIRLIPSKG